MEIRFALGIHPRPASACLSGRVPLTFHDAHAKDYLPQGRIEPMPEGLSDAARHRIEIPLTRISNIDLTRLVHVGLDLTANLPTPGTIYVDDVAFIR